MKAIIFIFFTQLINASELYKFTNQNKNKEIIKVEQLEGMRVNQTCYKNQKECFSYLIKAASLGNNNKNNPRPKSSFARHPASAFCNLSTGLSEIYYDQENNQHDYCVINKKFIIDSWDFYRRFKHD